MELWSDRLFMNKHQDESCSSPTPSWVREAGGAADTTIEENWLFRLRRERFRSRTSDKVHDYFVMHLADAVNVIALTPDDHVLLVRQFRAGSARDSLEPPGGLLDPGEDPCAAGTRELLEETGYAGDAAVLLGSAWSNPSILSSRIAVVVVANARRVAEPKLDELEEVSVEVVPARSIPRMIREGRIDHALSVMSLLWWLDNREKKGLTADDADGHR
jgi:8-oxo-dGTP pyrophosphatase MutT (NUDIX family)